MKRERKWREESGWKRRGEKEGPAFQSPVSTRDPRPLNHPPQLGRNSVLFSLLFSPRSLFFPPSLRTFFSPSPFSPFCFFFAFIPPPFSTFPTRPWRQPLDPSSLSSSSSSSSSSPVVRVWRGLTKGFWLWENCLVERMKWRDPLTRSGRTFDFGPGETSHMDVDSVQNELTVSDDKRDDAL